MRTDIIEQFCQGKRPKDLIQKKVANPKTIYYYHSIYNQLREIVESDDFKNQIIRLLLVLRRKDND